MRLLKKFALMVLKRVAIHIVQKEGGRLQANMKAAVLANGPRVVDSVLDSAQAKLMRALNGIRPKRFTFLKSLIDKVKEIVQSEGDGLQNRLKAEIAERGPDGVDSVLDGSQAILIARIKDL